MKLFLALLLALEFLSLRLQAQQLRSIMYTVDEGLPSNELYDVYEDGKGYLWLASDQGIARFDGVEFDNFDIQDGLSNPTIFSCKPDRHGWLWMRGIDGSLSVHVDGKLYPFPYNAALRAVLGARFIEDFHWAQDGSLFFSASGRPQELFVWGPQSKKARPLRLAPGKNLAVLVEDGRPVFAHFEEGTYPAGVPEGLPAGFVETTVQHIPAHGAKGVSMLAMQDSSAVIGIGDQVIRWRGGRVVGAPIEIVGRRGITCNQLGEVLICGNQAVWKWRPGADPEILHQIDAPCAKAIQDRNGNYWMATHQGLHMLPHLLLREPNPLSLMGLGEPTRLQQVPQGLICSFADPSALCLFPQSSDGLDLAKKAPVFQMRVDLHDFGMDTGGKMVYGIDPAILLQGKSPVKPNIQVVNAKTTRGIYDVNVIGGIVHYATKFGWLIADAHGGTLVDSRAHGFSDWCTAIERDARGRLWIGTRDQLMYVDGRETRPFAPGNPLFHARITSIAAGPMGILAVSTRGNGVILLRGGRYWQVDKAMGMPSNQCGRLFWGKRGLWVATNQGLALISWRPGHSQPTLRVLTNKMGLSSLMVHDVVETDQHVYVATANGLNWFDFATFDAPQYTFPMRITQASVRGQAFAPGRCLAWDENQIRFEFGAARLLPDRQARYRYRLMGYDPVWRTSDAGFVTYLGLPPGDFRFQVAGRTAEGRWDSVSADFDFQIVPHFSQTWWFRWCLGLALVLLAYLVLLDRVRRRRRADAQKVRLKLAEIKALRAQMKPHFLYNALNAIQHSILQGDRLAGASLISAFAALSRRILAQSDRSSITLQEEIETLRMYIELERMRFDKGFAYHLDVVGADVMDLEIPPAIIQPFVENAILHGLLHQPHDPTLWIRVLVRGDVLEWQIEDNGPGRAAATLRTGHMSLHNGTALQNIQERIDLLNAIGQQKLSFQITDRQPHGTKVVLFFSLESMQPIV